MYSLAYTLQCPSQFGTHGLYISSFLLEFSESESRGGRKLLESESHFSVRVLSSMRIPFYLLHVKAVRQLICDMWSEVL